MLLISHNKAAPHFLCGGFLKLQVNLGGEGGHGRQRMIQNQGVFCFPVDYCIKFVCLLQ